MQVFGQCGKNWAAICNGKLEARSFLAYFCHSGILAGPRWECLAGLAVRHSGVPFLLAIKRCTARLATSKRWAHFLCDQKNREVKVQKMLYGQQETNLRPSNFACSALLAKLPLLLTTSTFAGAGEGLRSSSWLQKRINAVLDNHIFFPPFSNR